MKNILLKKGSMGEEVFKLQHMLKKLEYKINVVSNVFNQETSEAVKSFQNDSSLLISGNCDSKTFRSLESLYNARFPDSKEIDNLYKESDNNIDDTEEKKENTSEDKFKEVDESNSDENKIEEESIQVSEVIENKIEIQKLDEVDNDNESQKEFEEDNSNEEEFQNNNELPIEDEPETNFPDISDIEEPENIPDENEEEYFKNIEIIDEPEENEEEENKSDENSDTGKKREAKIENLTYPILRYGSSGEYVKILQERLKDIGIFDEKIDGNFGKDTLDAVKRFQTSVDLKADGIVGRDTWRALETFDNYFPDNQFVLKEHDFGENVVEVQEILKKHGFLDSDVDGVFGHSTSEAVKNFQRAVGLKPTGIVDSKTYEILHQYEELFPTNVSDTYLPFSEGARGNDVKALQEKLIEYGFLKGNADGIFGSQTTTALKNFQKEGGLTADGVVGKDTASAINNYNPSSPSPPSTSRPNLSEGSIGSDVRYLQEKLLELGFSTSPPDGIFGPKTTLAVIKFQNALNLPATGIVDADTWNALENFSSSINQKPTLSIGSTGPYVVLLQKTLNELNFFDGEIDGIFGNQTRDAVKEFQIKSGLYPDGIVGAKTWEKLNILDIPNSRPVISEGSVGESVVLLQEELFALGFYTGPITGIFNAQTTEAVKKFQESIKLTPDGIVDKATWAALENQFTSTSEKPLLKYGSTGSYVIILQNQLKNLGYYSSSITGSFGTETENAVKKFQFDNGLVADGIVGIKTWQAIFKDSSAGEGETTTPNGPAPILRYGDHGDFVKYLQNSLKSILYFDGEADGFFGRYTLAVVKTFQSANKLQPDGIVGKDTWDAIYNSVPPKVVCN